MAEAKTRPGRLRSAAHTTRERLVEVVRVDVLVWEPVRVLREPRTRVPVDLHRLTAQTAAEWRSRVPTERHRDLDAFLARGDSGHLALVAGEYAGWIWLSRVSHRDPWSGLRIHLAADEAYAYAMFVEPEQRPNGVAAVLMTAMLSEVRDDPGLARVFGWVDQGNRESQMMMRMLGFKPVQQVKRLHLLGRFGFQVPRSDSPRRGPVSRP